MIAVDCKPQGARYAGYLYFLPTGALCVEHITDSGQRYDQIIGRRWDGSSCVSWFRIVRP